MFGRREAGGEPGRFASKSLLGRAVSARSRFHAGYAQSPLQILISEDNATNALWKQNSMLWCLHRTISSRDGRARTIGNGSRPMRGDGRNSTHTARIWSACACEGGWGSPPMIGGLGGFSGATAKEAAGSVRQHPRARPGDQNGVEGGRLELQGPQIPPQRIENARNGLGFGRAALRGVDTSLKSGASRNMLPADGDGEGCSSVIRRPWDQVRGSGRGRSCTRAVFSGRFRLVTH